MTASIICTEPHSVPSKTAFGSKRFEDCAALIQALRAEGFSSHVHFRDGRLELELKGPHELRRLLPLLKRHDIKELTGSFGAPRVILNGDQAALLCKSLTLRTRAAAGRREARRRASLPSSQLSFFWMG